MCLVNFRIGWTTKLYLAFGRAWIFQNLIKLLWWRSNLCKFNIFGCHPQYTKLQNREVTFARHLSKLRLKMTLTYKKNPKFRVCSLERSNIKEVTSVREEAGKRFLFNQRLTRRLSQNSKEHESESGGCYLAVVMNVIFI